MAVVSDIKKALSPQWRHSNRVYAILEYNYIVFPITLALVFYCKHMFPITRLTSALLTYLRSLQRIRQCYRLLGQGVRRWLEQFSNQAFGPIWSHPSLTDAAIW